MENENEKEIFPAGLPEMCYFTSPYTGCTVRIFRGDRCLYGIAGHEHANVLNNQLHLTKQQVAAMIGGVKYGWHSPQADPANYGPRGRYIGPVKGDTNGKERT